MGTVMASTSGILLVMQAGGGGWRISELRRRLYEWTVVSGTGRVLQVISL